MCFAISLGSFSAIRPPPLYESGRRYPLIIRFIRFLGGARSPRILRWYDSHLLVLPPHGSLGIFLDKLLGALHLRSLRGLVCRSRKTGVGVDSVEKRAWF